MRVGIVSIYDNGNMGNKLQNYALQQTLLQYAADVVTIKNKPLLKNVYKYFRRHCWLTETTTWNKLIGNRRKVQLLLFDRKYIHTSRKAYWHNLGGVTLKKEDRCEIYCAGSDQNWNPYFGRRVMFNYLGFADRERTFSYAASFGVNQIADEYEASVRKGLQHVKYISVREDAGKQIVEDLTGRTDVQVLVDPTMLLTTDEWNAVAEPPEEKLPEKYILTYFLGEVSQERRAAIQQKAKELGCELIELMDRNSPFYAIGPGSFVYLISHADLICTDSFHGSVFSFLYGRPLTIFDREGNENNMKSRMETLVAKFSLQDCVVAGNALPNIQTLPDYAVSYKTLKAEREKAKSFLDMVFQEAERAGLCD